VLCALGLAVLGMSAATLAAEDVAHGEYVFLLLCSLTGAIVLAYAGDLITVIVAVETLTLPLYVLVAARRRRLAAAEAAVNILVVSVAAGAVTLFGAALLYAATSTMHLDALAVALEGDVGALHVVAIAMVIGGLAFKVAAVPLHGWAPGAYDGAPLPIAAHLSTVSKLGGVVALLWIVTRGLGPLAATGGLIIAIISIATMTVGNLAALRQTRAVRLLAWSSIAQAGYLLAPFAILAAEPDDTAVVAIAVLGYAVFYVLLEATAFAAVTALRGTRDDGGSLSDYAGAARRHPLTGGALILALIGLAGLPPGFAGLFAKVTVVSALAVPAPVVAIVVGVNAVIALTYYLRFARVLLARAPFPNVPQPWPVAFTVAASTAAVVIIGFAPQFVLNLV